MGFLPGKENRAGGRTPESFRTHGRTSPRSGFALQPFRGDELYGNGERTDPIRRNVGTRSRKIRTVRRRGNRAGNQSFFRALSFEELPCGRSVRTPESGTPDRENGRAFVPPVAPFEILRHRDLLSFRFEHTLRTKAQSTGKGHIRTERRGTLEGERFRLRGQRPLEQYAVHVRARPRNQTGLPSGSHRFRVGSGRVFLKPRRAARTRMLRDLPLGITSLTVEKSK